MKTVVKVITLKTGVKLMHLTNQKMGVTFIRKIK
jgi:hypothetical protein